MDQHFLTRREAVAMVRGETGIPLTYSRLMKDAMLGVGPRPVALFGRQRLYARDDVIAYARGLLKPVEVAAA